MGQKKVKNQKPVDKNKPIIEYLDADIDEVRQRLVNLMQVSLVGPLILFVLTIRVVGRNQWKREIGRKCAKAIS